MPEDEATDIIQELDLDAQKEVLSQMQVKDAVVIKDLITYEEETAGGLLWSQNSTPFQKTKQPEKY